MIISITPKFASCLFEMHFPHPSTLHNPVIPKQTLICFLSLWFSLYLLEFYINGITFWQAFCSISISSFMCWTDQWFILFYWWITYIYIYIYVNLSIHTLLMNIWVISSFCCCSVAKSCPTLCDSMDCSMLGFTILCYFPDFAQTYVHGVNDAI